MTADVYTCVTDYAWSDDSRPELRLSESNGTHFATLSVGRADRGRAVLELSGGHGSVVDELEGYAEIFAKAAECLRGKE